eukprot:Platyproteum_vivax@DN4810_c0_g1_i1.p1
MADWMTKQAAGVAFKNFEDQISTSTFSGRSNPNQPQIDWENYNYPPGLRLVHYDPKELPAGPCRTAKLMNFSWLLTFVLLLWNLVATIVLAAAGVAPINVLYAVLNLVILPVVHGVAFYLGYKGIARDSPSARNRYSIVTVALLVFFLFIAIVHFGSFNGFVRLYFLFKSPPVYEISAGMRGFWIFTTVFESSGWVVQCGLLIYTNIKVFAFHPSDLQTTTNSGGRT